jgi:hypothetical protein
MTIRLASAALAVAALTLTGCASGVDTAGSTSDDAPAGSNRPVDEATAEPATAEEPTEEPTEAAFNTFGQTYTWENNLSVAVSPPEPYKRGEYAAGGEGAAHHVAFTVTIVNNTGKIYEPSMFTTTVQSANAEGDQVYDSQNGMEGAPMTKVLPGRESKFKIAYGVESVEDIVMEVSPGFEYQSTIFTS